MDSVQAVKRRFTVEVFKDHTLTMQTSLVIGRHHRQFVQIGKQSVNSWIFNHSYPASCCAWYLPALYHRYPKLVRDQSPRRNLALERRLDLTRRGAAEDA